MKTTISRGGIYAPNPFEGIDPALRARFHARFPQAPHFAPIPEPAPRPAPWDLIRQVLAQGRADGLDDRQLAGGVYAILVAHGLISEGWA